MVSVEITLLETILHPKHRGQPASDRCKLQPRENLKAEAELKLQDGNVASLLSSAVHAMVTSTSHLWAQAQLLSVAALGTCMTLRPAVPAEVSSDTHAVFLPVITARLFPLPDSNLYFPQLLTLDKKATRTYNTLHKNLKGNALEKC